MADLPLRGVSNRSLRERWRKWCRRQPYELFRVKTLLVASCAAVTIAALVWVAFLAPRFRAAGQALLEGRVLLDRRDYPEAARALTRGAALIEGLPGGERLSRELAAALRLADRLEEADRLHRLVDRLRFAESAANRPVPSAREVERHCRALWESRRSLLERPGTPLDPQLEQRLRDDLLDLAVIGSNLRVRLETDPKKAGEAHRAGPRAPRRSRGVVRPEPRPLPRAAGARHRSGPLEHGRRRRPRRIPGAASNGLGTRRRGPRPARGRRSRPGRGGLRAGPRPPAPGLMAEFPSGRVRLPPRPLPGCRQRLSRLRRAGPRSCRVLLQPRLAHAALGHTVEASRDYDRAVSLDPTLAAAPLDRGVPHRPTAPSRRVTP